MVLKAISVAIALVGSQLGLATPLFAETHLHSAARPRGEPASRSYARYLQRLREKTSQQDFQTRQQRSVADSSQPMSELDFSDIPQWRAPFGVEEAFRRVRDLRFLTDPEHPRLLRRSSWLYPDDGCFARAELMHANLRHWGADAPKKVFVFGELEADTDNTPGRRVSWWYHVAPLVRVGSDLWVLDPSIDPRRPLRLLAWVQTMTSDVRDVELAICEPGAYAPSSSCQSTTQSETTALADQAKFLPAEWRRLEILNRDPEEELGDSPPWLP